MMKRMKYYLFIFLFFNISCMERFSIDESIEPEEPGQFGAGDTTFLQIQPLWDTNYGISDPVEISIAQDGRIFVADEGNNSILVFNQNGTRPTGFEQLIDLRDGFGEIIAPIDVDIDKKMNVFFIDGSQKIFVWNQYWNDVGINKISTSLTFFNQQTGVDTVAYAGTNLFMELINTNDWEIIDVVMSTNQTLIDSLKKPHIFYDGMDEVNLYLDAYFKSDSSKFSGVTVASDNENWIFVTDNFGGQANQYRIIQIDFKRSLLLELKTGDLVWAYTGHFGSTVKGYGTGAGTVNQPQGLDVDYQGNLYYTQLGDYFSVHMISPDLSGDFAVYTSGFQPGGNQIMDMGRFISALDVSVDNQRNVYVVDNVNSDITVFNFEGDYFKKIGYDKDSLTTMIEPVAVAIDDRGVVYACDRASSSIYRFKLSNTLNEDIIPED